MTTRTFGWVQNPNKLDTLRYIVEIFYPESSGNIDLIRNKIPLLEKYYFISQENSNKFKALLHKNNIEIPYDLLKGKGKGSLKSRKDALCTGIIQAAITAHSTSKTIKDKNGICKSIKKPYVDDWTADGYLRWAISTGLIEYSSTTDSCKISPLGIKLALTDKNSDEEKEVFTKALLSYPPVYRVLEILSDKNKYTKFEIGAQLGFKGEMGFTSIPQEVFVYDYCNESNPQKRKDIKSNVEGDSDKYARGIATWLVQMGWLTKTNKTVTENYFGQTNTTTLQAWQITRLGEKALLASKGNSSNPAIAKIVKYEMLATKVPNTDFVRFRRASILKNLKTEKSIGQIKSALLKLGLDEPVETIKDEIQNFSNIGISIVKNNEKYKLKDKIIDLEIPEKITLIKEDITKLKDYIRERLHNINHEYLILVDLAYSDANSKKKKNNDAKDFEIQTAKLFTKELNFYGERLGDSNRPDVIIYKEEHGIIIDNKSYKQGFSVDKHCADEISRYINQNNQRIPNVPTNEWWKNFDSSVSKFNFLFVTSYLKGNFKNNLKEIATLTSTNGAAISVDNLLFLADEIKSQRISYTDFYNMFKNDEITVYK